MPRPKIDRSISLTSHESAISTLSSTVFFALSVDDQESTANYDCLDVPNEHTHLLAEERPRDPGTATARLQVHCHERQA